MPKRELRTIEITCSKNWELKRSMKGSDKQKKHTGCQISDYFSWLSPHPYPEIRPHTCNLSFRTKNSQNTQTGMWVQREAQFPPPLSYEFINPSNVWLCAFWQVVQARPHGMKLACLLLELSECLFCSGHLKSLFSGPLLAHYTVPPPTIPCKEVFSPNELMKLFFQPRGHSPH